MGATGWDFGVEPDGPPDGERRRRRGAAHRRGWGAAAHRRVGRGARPRPSGADPDGPDPGGPASADAVLTAVLPVLPAPRPAGGVDAVETTLLPVLPAPATPPPDTAIPDPTIPRSTESTNPDGTDPESAAPTGGDPDATPSATVHERVRAEPEFAELRRRQRRFVFPATAGFLLWYLAYVLLASYARDLMATPVADGINLGLVVGLLQFVSTFAIGTAYVVYARHRLDPLAEQLRERVEGARREGDAAEPDGAPAVPADGRLFGDVGGLR